MRTLILSCAIVALLSCTAVAEPLELKPGESVVFIGNTLFDRAQDFGTFESLLHQRYPNHKLRVRTLAWSGDAVNLRPRPDSFKDMHTHLTTQKADVIIAAYGFNESFAGADGLAAFRKDLAAMLRELKGRKYNGKSAPRIVLVSPIGHENLGAPLPDGTESNANQKLYADAMAQVAKAEGVGFVDVLTPMLRAMTAKTKKAPLTINGIHLNDAGYRAFAGALYRGLFQEDAPTIREAVREVVVEKNAKFFRWYRTLNGFYIYGGRKNPYGVKNFPLELQKWTQLTANRDARIWNIAQGKKVPATIDDSNTVKLPTITGNRPINEWMSAADELKSFTVDPRFEVNCFASEEDFPELACPIQMRWDARGRLWVSCSTAYPQVTPGELAKDKIIILEDTDGDGKADKCTTFADDLHIPLSFELGDGGAYVSEQPHMTFLKDTDGDGKADHREKILTGFGTEDSHHALHDFTWSPDGDLILRESIFHHSQIETPHGPVRVRESSFFRYRPATESVIAFGSYRSTNPWGLTFDKWGRHNGSHPVYAAAIHARNAVYPNIHAPAGSYFPAYSGTCGQEFVTSKQWPDELQGTFVRVRYKPTQTIELHDWVDGGTHFTEKKHKTLLIQSKNLSFIPVDVRFGPRGALYIVDWYNPVKGHAQYSLRDTRRDKKSGRIWRITAKNRPLQPAPKIAGASTSELLDHLKAYEYRTRYRAKRELRDHDAAKVKAALDSWLASLDANHPEYEHHRTEAMWLYRGIGSPNTVLTRSLLTSKNEHARSVATQQLRYTHAAVDPDAKLLAKMANDKSGHVRLEAAIAASYYRTPAAIAAAVQITDHPMDNYTTYALRTSLDSLKPIWQKDVALLKANPKLLAFMADSGPKKAHGGPNTTLGTKQTRANRAWDRKHKPRTVTIKAVPERLLFDVTEFTVKPGQAIRLELINPDATAHNLIICAPGSEMEIGMAANEMAKTDEGMKKQFIPASKKVLWATKLLGPGEKESLRFHAPKKPGVYPYICTFPGHWLVMKGKMIVK